MQIEYSVSQNGLRIETYPKGVLDIEGTVDYFDRLKNDKRINKDAIEIVYFKDVSDYAMSYLEIERVTKQYQEPRSLQMIAMTIFVCETDLAYGIGRMLQTLHGIASPNHKVEVVNSEEDIEKTIEAIQQAK